jgi:hypothetical protein
LNHVDVFGHARDLRFGKRFDDGRKAVASRGARDERQRVVAETLEIVGRRARFVGAAAQHRAARRADEARRFVDLRLALDRTRAADSDEAAVSEDDAARADASVRFGRTLDQTIGGRHDDSSRQKENGPPVRAARSRTF